MVRCNIKLDIHVAMHNIAVIGLQRSFAARPVSSRAKAHQTEGDASGVEGMTMMQQFEVFQKAGKDNVDAALKSFGAASKGMQAIAVEAADYSKKSFENGTSLMEKLVGVKTIDKAFELQADFAKSSYEGAVAQATKMGELYTAALKEAFKPFEAAMAKMTPAAK